MTKRKVAKKSAPVAVAPVPVTSSFELRRCLITIELTCQMGSVIKPVISPDTNDLGWCGSLWDLKTLGDPKHSSPISQLLIPGEDSYSHGRVIRTLQSIAYTEGYEHCEIRDYTYEKPGCFIPLFSGPIPNPRASFLDGEYF
jgi:hypothetical protein